MTCHLGGISILLVGDIAQLPPVSDTVLYHQHPRHAIAFTALEGIKYIAGT